MKQPNVLVFFTDQQRFDSTGAHGNPLGLTPHFDGMARRGTHLRHSFTCQPVCGPARACLQTGIYPTRLGCFANNRPLQPQHKTLAHHFGAAGYRTGYIGKWHLADGDCVGAVAPHQRGGYEFWLAANRLEHTSDAYDTRLYDNDEREMKLPGYRVDALADAAIRFLAEPRDEPFFLFLSFLEPHFQNHRDDYPAPRDWETRFIDRWTPPDLQSLNGTAAQHLPGYWGMVKKLDDALGRVLDALHSLDLDNTIVLFTSDHGCHFKTRNEEYKRSCHEASIRVPTAFCGGPFEGGGQVQQLISLIDLPPTLLDAAGIAVPDEMQGRSLLPLLRGQKADWPEEMFVQISESYIGRCVRTRRWKYAVGAPELVHEGAFSSVYDEEHLYDLLADPWELTNLAGLESHRAVADALQNRLLRRMREAGEAPAEIRPATPRRAAQRRVSEKEIWQ